MPLCHQIEMMTQGLFLPCIVYERKGDDVNIGREENVLYIVDTPLSAKIPLYGVFILFESKGDHQGNKIAYRGISIRLRGMQGTNVLTNKKGSTII
jgi:hypothetical protein